MPNSAVSARLAPEISWYAVRVQVCLPPTYRPLVKLQPHQLISFGGRIDLAAFDRAMQISKRANDERGAIVDMLYREFRFPTEEEQRRFDELGDEAEIAWATFDQTRATLN